MHAVISSVTGKVCCTVCMVSLNWKNEKRPIGTVESP